MWTFVFLTTASVGMTCGVGLKTSIETLVSGVLLRSPFAIVTPFTCNFLSVKSYFTLRWVKDARLTMASTPRHSLVGQIMVNQAITTANIAKATAAIASVAKENKNTHGWKLHVGFGLEDEVNKAVQLALTDEGYTNINALDFFKAIKGLDGKDEYNFDGVFEAIKEDDNYLFVGETKQYLEGHGVLDAEAEAGRPLAWCENESKPSGGKVIQQPNKTASGIHRLHSSTVCAWVSSPAWDD